MSLKSVVVKICNQKSAILILLFPLLLMLCGCGAFDLVAGKDSEPHTKIENILNTVGKGVRDVTGFVPGYGAIGGGIAAVLGLIGHSITSVVVTRKRKNALCTVIKGIEVGSAQYDALMETILKTVESLPGVKAKVQEAFERSKPVKEIIAEISAMIGNATFIDKQVQKVTAGM